MLKAKKSFAMVLAISLMMLLSQVKGFDNQVFEAKAAGGFYSYGYVTQHFGDYFDYNGRNHLGTDFGSANGSAIKAIYSGTVVDKGFHAGYGNYIVIKHSSPVEFKSLYAHLSSISVSVNQTVSSGQNIGVMGNTGGLSFGAHLHLSIYRGGGNSDLPDGYSESRLYSLETNPRSYAYSKGGNNFTVYNPVSVFETGGSILGIVNENNVTIVYNDNGGSGAPYNTSFSPTVPVPVYFSSTVPVRYGYKFGGWQYLGGIYHPGSQIPFREKKSYNLYAQWSVDTTSEFTVYDGPLTIRPSASTSGSLGTVPNGTKFKIKSISASGSYTFANVTSSTNSALNNKWIAISGPGSETYCVSTNGNMLITDGPLNVRETASAAANSSGVLTNGTRFKIDSVSVNGSFTFGRITGVTKSGLDSTCSASAAIGKWVAISGSDGAYCIAL